MEIIKKLKENNGSSYIKGAVIVFIILIVTLATVEICKVILIQDTLRDNVTNAVISVASDNSAIMFSGIRESDARPLNMQNIDFSNIVGTDDVVENLKKTLRFEDSNLAKYSKGRLIYEISDIKTVFVTSSMNTASFKTTFDLKIPLYFGSVKLTEINVKQNYTSVYAPRY